MLESLKNWYLKRAIRNRLERFYAVQGLSMKTIENNNYVDLYVATEETAEMAIATISMLEEQNKIKAEYIDSLEMGYIKATEEIERLKAEGKKEAKVVWKLDQKQEELVMENLALKIQNKKLLDKHITESEKKDSEDAKRNTEVDKKEVKSPYESVNKHLEKQLVPDILNPTHITEEGKKQTVRIVSAADIPKGCEIQTPQGSSMHLSME